MVLLGQQEAPRRHEDCDPGYARACMCVADSSCLSDILSHAKTGDLEARPGVCRHHSYLCSVAYAPGASAFPALRAQCASDIASRCPLGNIHRPSAWDHGKVCHPMPLLRRIHQLDVKVTDDLAPLSVRGSRRETTAVAFRRSLFVGYLL